MIKIIEEFNKRNKYIIIDESFVDFTKNSRRYTLIDDEILSKYKKLIVIRSISKTYGIPGIRLGVLACGDANVIAEIRNNMPIWNINSFAEYFLQTIGLYKKEYNKACEKLIKEREWMYNQIKLFKKVKVYSSEANYLMVKLENINSEKLCVSLLENDDIFLKRLNNKSGFNNENYIRIAIRSREENQKLIEALRRYL